MQVSAIRQAVAAQILTISGSSESRHSYDDFIKLTSSDLKHLGFSTWCPRSAPQDHPQKLTQGVMTNTALHVRTFYRARPDTAPGADADLATDAEIVVVRKVLATPGTAGVRFRWDDADRKRVPGGVISTLLFDCYHRLDLQ